MEKERSLNDTEIKWIDVEGQQVVDLTPDYKRALALVDLEVINRLTKLLPKADLYEIKRGLKVKISAARSIEDMIDMWEDFIAFHRSVNLIQEVFVELKDNKLNEPIGDLRETIGDLEGMSEIKDKLNETVEDVHLGS